MPTAFGRWQLAFRNLAASERVLRRQKYSTLVFPPLSVPIQSLNPYTGRLLQSFPTLSAAAIEQVLAEAHQAAAAWRTTTFAERAAILRQAGALLRERQDELARLMALEMGKPVRDGRAETQKCAAS
ncbi:MAG: aldehyde dehydrogenase family protein [Hymenobacter sp.]|nr:MAG: aldehyde dehydrogenase family protein [Hymenobacter sp.]